MTDTSTVAPADRAAMRFIGAIIAGFGAASVGFGTAHIVALARGDAQVSLLVDGALPGTDVAATVSTADVASASLDSASRALLIAGTAVEVVTGTIITVAVIALLLRIAAGQPFHRSLFKLGVIAGFALLVGGIAGTALRGLGQMQAAMSLNGDADGPFTPGFVFDPGMWWLAFVVLALAMVFRIGTRLQRDTEGLV